MPSVQSCERRKTERCSVDFWPQIGGQRKWMDWGEQTKRSAFKRNRIFNILRLQDLKTNEKKKNIELCVLCPRRATSYWIWTWQSWFIWNYCGANQKGAGLKLTEETVFFPDPAQIFLLSKGRFRKQCSRCFVFFPPQRVDPLQGAESKNQTGLVSLL